MNDDSIYLIMTFEYKNNRRENSVVPARYADKTGQGREKTAETIGHDYAFPRRGGRGSVRNGERRKF